MTCVRYWLAGEYSRDWALNVQRWLSRTFVRTRVLFASLTSREGAVMRSLNVTNLVTYRVYGAILNAVYRERAERTLVRLLCLKRHALNASRIRLVNDSRL